MVQPSIYFCQELYPTSYDKPTILLYTTSMQLDSFNVDLKTCYCDCELKVNFIALGIGCKSLNH